MEASEKPPVPGAPEMVPAATVVLVRDRAGGLETLMLKRNSTIAFGGMWVFPGGRVDPGDVDPDRPDDELAAARRAAVREAEEEAGLVVAEDELVVLSHWVPPPTAPRKFSTWFFLATAPVGSVVIDGGEIHDHRWLRPAEALERRDAGEIELAPPTWVTLWELAAGGDVAGVLARACGRDPEHFATQLAKVDGDAVALWHGDVGYGEGDAAGGGARHRLTMADGGWHYQRDTPS